ncbi:MAG: GlsB/YeaQ/YmgE family stress response membrane protein [Vulcanimicrobiota bacterium]
MNSIVVYLLFLIVAAICAAIASAIVPGRLPGGFLAAMVIGVIGAWLGVSLIGPVGPALAGVSLLPAIFGSALLIFGFALLSRMLGSGRLD